MSSIGPEVVINAAAWTEVDACESDPSRAYRDNAFSVRLLADACGRVGAHLVTISTDYVFDGTKDEPYDEWDVPNPRSVYGASKLAGEREAGPRATIVRTSWMSGAGGPNVVKTILGLLDDHPILRFVDDQVGHPTFSADLAPVVADLAVQKRSGVYHVTNQGAVSWFRVRPGGGRCGRGRPGPHRADQDRRHGAPCASSGQLQVGELRPPTPGDGSAPGFP